MAYSKQPKLCTDAVFGLRQFNAAADNAAASKAYLDVQHGTDGSGGHPWTRLGAHNEGRIARTVFRVYVTTFRGQVQFSVELEGPALLGVERYDVGKYGVNVANLAEYWLMVTPEADATSDLRWIQQELSELAANAPQGWLLTLWDQASAGAGLTEADYSFGGQILGLP